MAEITLQERFDKIRSPNLESQQQTAIVLNAVESTFKEQNSEATPTAYFAALLALLSQSVGEDVSKKNLDTSIIYLLDLVTPYAPHGLLRAKFTQILSSLAPVLMSQSAEAPLLRSSIGCLESLLRAQDAAAWDQSAAQISPRRAVAGLLKLSVDPRPKVRKRALEALKNVLDAPPPGPTLDHPASAMCAETAMASLKELAERRAGQLKKDKQQQHRGGGGGSGAQAAHAAHDPELIHALQLVRAIAASSSGWPTKKIESLCELLLEIARTGSDYMSVAVLEVFEMIFQGMTDEIAASKLHRLLEILAELRPAPNDTQLLPPWIAIVSRGYDVAAQVEPEDTFYQLPELFAMVTPYLESPAANIRVSAAECLVSFLANCVPQQVVLEPSVYDEKVLTKLAAAAGDLLGVRYQAAAAEVYGVLAALYDALRWRADPVLQDVTRTLGDMRGSDTFVAKKEVDRLLGHAIRAMGPAAVLRVLPLNLLRPSAEQPGRAWLLPLFRDYTTNTRLADFKAEFVPLSNALYQRVLDHGEAEKTTETKIFETIVQQIWSILPGFCDLPLDLQASFDGAFGELLANLLYQQVGLRLDICRALKTLVESNQAILELRADDEDEDENEEDEGNKGTADDEDDDLFVQCRISKAEARANLAHLGSFASQYLAVLFNVYGQTLAQSRGPILQTINAFLSVTPQAVLVQSFDEVCKLLAAELETKAKAAAASKGKKGGAAAATAAASTAAASGQAVPSTSHTLMDLVIAMALHLPRESYSALFAMAALAIGQEEDAQLQKKANKLIPRLAESAVGRAALATRHAELQQLMLASAEAVTAPARRERLAALAALVPVMPADALHFIPATLSEVVISCKEHNERAREAAFSLLVAMGERMAAAGGTGARIDLSKVPQLGAAVADGGLASIDEFFTMVSAGLAGSTPHMISASVTALTRILYAFHEQLDPAARADLVQTVELFLTSNNREIVRSVLGFVKVCTISLPADLMRERLPTLIPHLMVWSHEHKGHFRAKVKHILDRMGRRFGYDLVTKYCPEADRKLIANIRKTKERNKRKKKALAEDAAGGGGGGDDDDDEDGAGGGGGFRDDDGGRSRRLAQAALRREAASGFDAALYDSSDSSDDEDGKGGDDDDDDDDDEGGAGGRKKGRRAGGAKGGQAFIIEEEGEPLDLLDRKALASISSTRPLKPLLRATKASKARFNADGKLLLGDGSMDIDQDEGGGAALASGGDEGASGVDAYMAAVSGQDVPKRGLRGKLRWSNKRGQDDDGDGDDDVVMDDATTAAIKAKLEKGPKSPGRPQQQQAARGSGGGRGGRGRGGGRGGERGGHGRSGSGGGGFGRRGLGEDKRRGGAVSGGGRVGKAWPKKR